MLEWLTLRIQQSPLGFLTDPAIGIEHSALPLVANSQKELAGCLTALEIHMYSADIL
jgi:hypothetical protein